MPVRSQENSTTLAINSCRFTVVPLNHDITTLNHSSLASVCSTSLSQLLLSHASSFGDQCMRAFMLSSRMFHSRSFLGAESSLFLNTKNFANNMIKQPRTTRWRTCEQQHDALVPQSTAQLSAYDCDKVADDAAMVRSSPPTTSVSVRFSPRSTISSIACKLQQGTRERPPICFRMPFLTLFFSLHMPHITTTMSEVFVVKVEGFEKCSLYVDSVSNGSIKKILSAPRYGHYNRWIAISGIVIGGLDCSNLSAHRVLHLQKLNLCIH